jgi:pSer/pThr/pTyr-binding forkhead associated (FHA) protein
MSDKANNKHKERTLETVHEQKKHKIKSSELLTSKAVLLVVSRNFFGDSFVINEPEITVGRSEKCDFRVNDPHISAQHCTITVGEDCKYFIEDMDSTNSTFINRKELTKKVQLLYGDRIVMGKTILRFYVEEEIDEK